MIYLTVSTPQSVCLQMTVSCTTKWEHDWQMHFNPNKCFVMRLTHARNVKQFNYTLGNTTLQETGSHSFLGVCITKDLNWNKHIHQIIASANRTLAFIRRNFYSCPINTKNGLHDPSSPTSRIFIF